MLSFSSWLSHYCLYHLWEHLYAVVILPSLQDYHPRLKSIKWFGYLIFENSSLEKNNYFSHGWWHTNALLQHVCGLEKHVPLRQTNIWWRFEKWKVCYGEMGEKEMEQFICWTATKGHIWVSDSIAVGSCVNVHGLCYPPKQSGFHGVGYWLKKQWCPSSVLLFPIPHRFLPGCMWVSHLRVWVWQS